MREFRTSGSVRDGDGNVPIYSAMTPLRRADANKTMIRIAITVEAYEAIVATLPLGSVAYEAEPNAKGERLI